MAVVDHVVETAVDARRRLDELVGRELRGARCAAPTARSTPSGRARSRSIRACRRFSSAVSTTRRSVLWNAPSSVSQVSSLNFVVSTTSVSPSQRPTASPRASARYPCGAHGRRSARCGRSCRRRRRRGTALRPRAARSCRAARFAARPARSSAAPDPLALGARSSQRPSPRARIGTTAAQYRAARARRLEVADAAAARPAPHRSR